MRLISIVDNVSAPPHSIAGLVKRLESPDRHFLSEHGFSLLVETDKGQKVLVDAGASEEVLEHNLALLGIPPQSIDAVFISHGHYDHVGGLLPFIKARVPIYSHPNTFQGKRFAVAGIKVTDISVPPRILEALPGANLNLSSSSVEIVEGVRTSGEIQRQFPFEPAGNYLREEEGKMIEDSMSDEQALYLASKKGLIIISGCGHGGVVNVVQQARKATGSKVFMLVGGFHLYGGDTDRLLKTMDHLKNLGVERVVPTHCTGFEAMKLLSDRFTGFELLSVGSEIDI